MSYIIRNKKLLVTTVLLGGFIASILTFALSSAAGPQFNIFPLAYNAAENTDLPLLDGRNLNKGEGWSTSQSDHDNGIQAKPGDIIELSVYFHNGTPDDPGNTAKNVVIKAFSNPALGTNQSQHWVSATISADNAQTVSSDDPARGGNMKINIEGGQSVALELVPGSVLLYKDRGLQPNAAPTQLADTIFSTGVNVGDVRGCFDFQGLVVFKVRVSQPAPEPVPFNPVCELIWSEPTLPDGRAIRKVGEASNYQMNISGMRPYQNFSIINTHSSGSPELSSNLQANAQGRYSQYVTTVIPANYIPGDYSTILKWNTSVPCTSFRIVADQPPAQNTFELGVTKQVRNVSIGQTAFSNSTSAEPGQRVEFRIVVNSNGSDATQSNVFLKDTIDDSRLTYVTNTLQVEGAPRANGNQLFVGSGINLGGLAPNRQITAIFQADIAGSNSFTIGQTETLVNRVQTRSDQVGARQAEANVSVTRTGSPVQPTRDLEIDKTVRNVSDGQSNFGSVTNANPGEEVEYRITVRTLGNAQQNNVRVSDALPNRISYVSGDDLRGNGRNLGTLAAGTERTFTFRARIDNGSSFPDNSITLLQNTATVRSDEVSSRNDTAEVRVDDNVPVDNNRTLNVEKRVRNLSRGQVNFQDSVSASFDERVQFEIRIQTGGNASQSNVRVWDELPSGLSFVSGDDLRGSGQNLGTLSQGTTRFFTFEARVNTASNTTLTNRAFVSSSEVGERSDIATVFVQGDQGGVDERSLFINKQVRNITKNQFNYSDFVQAEPGDRVEFRIEFRLLGNASQNGVVLRDDFPSHALSFVSGDSRIIGSGINYGTLSAGTSRSEVFQATVLTSTSQNQIVNNTARVSSNQVGTVFDTAQVSINQPGIQSQLRKSAFNVTRNTDATTVTARPGDAIRYTLTFRNTSATTLNSVVVEDDIRDVLELSRVTNMGGALVVDNGVIKYAAVSLGPNQEVTRTFEVQVFETGLIPAGSDLVMTNVYGNEVRVVVERGQVLGTTIVPPRTGASEWLVTILAAISTFGVWAYRKRFDIKSLGV